MKHLAVLLSVVCFLMMDFQPIDSKEIVIIEKGNLNGECENSCQQTTEESLVPHCQRGCNLFDLAQLSDVLDLNETMTLTACTDSCKEAYLNEANQNACISGCKLYQTAFDDLNKLAQIFLEETKKEMNFFQQMLGLMNSAIFSQPSADSDVSDGGLIDDQMSKLNRLDSKKNFNDDAELISVQGYDLLPIAEEPTITCNTRKWLHSLSVSLVLMGAIVIVCIGLCYLALFKIQKARKAKTLAVIESSMPPSYETAMRSEYIDLPKSFVPVHGQADKIDLKKSLI